MSPAQKPEDQSAISDYFQVSKEEQEAVKFLAAEQQVQRAYRGAPPHRK